MKNINWKKLLPHLVAFGIFITLILSYFSPMLKGYVIDQGDIRQFQGMSKEIGDHREIYDEEPYWTNSMFGGMPAYQISTYYHSNLTSNLDRVPKAIIPGVFGNLFICFITFYLLLVVLKVNPWLAIAGAIAYAMCSYNIIIMEAGHNTKLHALSFIPGLLAGVLLVLKENKIVLGGLLTALFTSLEVESNHVQVTYYFVITLIIMGVGYFVHSIINKTLPLFLKKAVVLIVAGVIGILTNTTTLWNTYTYGKDTMRGESELTINAGGEKNQEKTTGLDLDYMTNWSYGIGESWSFIIPNIKGGASEGLVSSQKEFDRLKDQKLKKFIIESQQNGGVGMNKYFGNQPFTSGPVYMGALICLLFILSLIYINNWIKWSLLAASILMLLLSWGNNFMWLTEVFANNFPMYNKFRTVSMTLVVLQFVFPFMAILFVQDIIKNKEKYSTKLKSILIVSGVFVLLLFIIAIAPAAFFNMLSNAEIEQLSNLVSQKGDSVLSFQADLVDIRSSWVTKDTFRSLFFIVSGILLLIGFLKNWFKEPVLLLGLALLILIDLWGVDKRYLNNDKDDRGNLISWKKKDKDDPFYSASYADNSIYEYENELNPSIDILFKKTVDSINTNKRLKGDLSLGLSKGELEALKFRTLNFNTNYRVLNLSSNTFNESRTSYYHNTVGGYHAAKLGRYQELIDFCITPEINLLRSTRDYSKLNVLNMLNTKYIIANPSQPALKNPFGNGNAWFIDKITFVPNADDEILTTQTINTKTEAVVDNKFKEIVGDVDNINSTGIIKLNHYQPNKLVYTSTNSHDGIAVFSEIFFDKGWNAYIDGKLAPHFRANYVLRGLSIPKGEHEVVFKFEPSAIRYGNIVGYSSSILLIIGFLAFFAGLFKKKINAKQQED